MKGPLQSAVSPAASAVLLFALSCAGSGPRRGVPGPAGLGSGDHTIRLTFEGRPRYCLVHVPSAAAPPTGRPVVLVLHGGGGEPAGLKEYSGMDATSDREGFLAVYPAGTGRLRERLLTWNAGTCCGYAAEQDVDDVGFMVALLHDLAARTPVDPDRVFVTGHSNGGMMAYRLAAEIPERIAAAAPVAGGMVAGSPPSGQAVPILHIHSVDDPRALYEGGTGPPFPLTNRRVDHPPVAATLSYWIARNGCASDSQIVERRAGRAGTDWAAHSAEHLVWEAGPAGAPVELWRLHGPGHAWPGADRGGAERLIGPSTRILDASEVVWAFFKRFDRPDAPSLGPG